MISDIREKYVVELSFFDPSQSIESFRIMTDRTGNSKNVEEFDSMAQAQIVCNRINQSPYPGVVATAKALSEVQPRMPSAPRVPVEVGSDLDLVRQAAIHSVVHEGVNKDLARTRATIAPWCILECFIDPETRRLAASIVSDRDGDSGAILQFVTEQDAAEMCQVHSQGSSHLFVAARVLDVLPYVETTPGIGVQAHIDLAKEAKAAYGATDIETKKVDVERALANTRQPWCILMRFADHDRGTVRRTFLQDTQWGRYGIRQFATECEATIVSERLSRASAHGYSFAPARVDEYLHRSEPEHAKTPGIGVQAYIDLAKDLQGLSSDEKVRRVADLQTWLRIADEKIKAYRAAFEQVHAWLERDPQSKMADFAWMKTLVEKTLKDTDLSPQREPS